MSIGRFGKDGSQGGGEVNDEGGGGSLGWW